MKSSSLLLAALALAVSGFANAQSGADLLKSKNCLTCHSGQPKAMGPAFKDVAAKYKGDKGAEAKIIASLKEGKKDGKGHPMKVVASDDELKAMVTDALAAK